MPGWKSRTAIDGRSARSLGEPEPEPLPVLSLPELPVPALFIRPAAAASKSSSSRGSSTISGDVAGRRYPCGPLTCLSGVGSESFFSTL